MLYFLSIEPNAKLVLMVIGICCILPILVIGLILLGKIIYKHRINMRKLREMEKNGDIVKEKKAKKTKTLNVNYLAFFGGDNNIVSISKNLSRVSVEVKDVKLVDFDALKNEGIGVMVTRNTIKCSSQAFADQISDK